MKSFGSMDLATAYTTPCFALHNMHQCICTFGSIESQAISKNLKQSANENYNHLFQIQSRMA